jgi:hypothetical protein
MGKLDDSRLFGQDRNEKRRGKPLERSKAPCLALGSFVTLRAMPSSCEDALSSNEVAQLYAIELSPPLSLLKAVTVQDYSLTVGSNYQVQVSGDLVNWTNQGSAFTATSSYWQSTNYFDVQNWNQLFFRLLPQ